MQFKFFNIFKVENDYLNNTKFSSGNNTAIWIMPTDKDAIVLDNEANLVEYRALTIMPWSHVENNINANNINT